MHGSACAATWPRGSMRLKTCCAANASAPTRCLTAQKDGWNSLISASSRGHYDVVLLLLEKGANINGKNMVSPRLPAPFPPFFFLLLFPLFSLSLAMGF